MEGEVKVPPAPEEPVTQRVTATPCDDGLGAMWRRERESAGQWRKASDIPRYCVNAAITVDGLTLFVDADPAGDWMRASDVLDAP